MSTASLLCKQCNFENEPERVYCHNCGAKLDRSLLPPEATKREDPVIVQNRVRKMVSPRRGAGGRQFKNLLSCLLLSAAIAAIVTLARPPDDVPEVDKELALNPPTITDDLETLLTQPTPKRLTYTEEQVNAFLKSSVRGKEESALGVISIKFERAFVHFDEGVVRITTEQTLFGYPLYAMTARRVEASNGTLVTSSLGGSFGRLPISPVIMPYLEGAFSSLFKALDHDRGLIAKLQSINFHKKSVDMVNAPEK